MMLPLTTRRFRSVLCAVDFSAQSAKALRYAAAVAGAAGGRVTAIHAVDPLLSAAAAVAYDSGALETRAHADLVRFVKRTIPGDAAAAVRCVVAVGAAGPVVLAYARRVRAGLVVMGTHGRRGAAKLFFGSTTAAVLRRFRGPILAIPPHCRGPQAAWPGGSIVAAIDAGRHRRAMLSAAARMAEAFGAWLSVAPAVPATATRRGTRMIILPLPSRGRLRMLRQGSAAYRFVCAARSPVLVLRAGSRAGAVTHPSRAA
jgi:nucleotide-binding universal stress UspA family protein